MNTTEPTAKTKLTEDAAKYMVCYSESPLDLESAIWKLEEGIAGWIEQGYLPQGGISISTAIKEAPENGDGYDRGDLRLTYFCTQAMIKQRS